jgi:2-methylcitrate dehydratase PrpD
LISKIQYSHVNDDTNKKLGEGGAMPPAKVKLILRSGTELGHTVKTPKGDPGNPMTIDELTAKFRDCAGRVLSAQKVDQCVDMLLNLESLEDISSLMDVITLA